MLGWLKNLGFGGGPVAVVDAQAFGVQSKINPFGQGVIGLMSVTGQGVTGLIYGSFGVQSKITDLGQGVTGLVIFDGKGVTGLM